MPRITLDLPEVSIGRRTPSPQDLAREFRIAAAIHWYSQGLISQGKASEIANLARADFIDELARQKVDVVQTDLAELEDELNRE